MFKRRTLVGTAKPLKAPPGARLPSFRAATGFTHHHFEGTGAEAQGDAGISAVGAGRGSHFKRWLYLTCFQVILTSFKEFFS
jgi:hypothetical protein